MSTNVEQLVVSNIVGTGEIVPYLEGGITAAFFSQERWNRAWAWVYGYWTEHGITPTAAAFSRQFPYPLLDEYDEPVAALIAELTDRRRDALLRVGLQEAVSAFDGDDSPEAIAALHRTLSSINVETTRADISRTSQAISTIVAEALAMKDFSITGIPTGFPTIDTATGGFQPEQLITVIGLPKHGKSTIGLAMCLAAQRHGKRGAIITYEMSNRELQQRYLSLGAEVDLNHILRGGWTDDERDRVKEFEAEVKEMPDLDFIYDRSSTMTVGGVAAKIEQISDLDFILVDGAYLMEDEHGEKPGSSQALTNITRSMKRLMQKRKMTGILTTQALESRTTKRNGVQVGSIGYTSSFAQDSDAIIGLDREDLMLPTGKLKILAARNSLGAVAELRFDYTMGLIEEVSLGATFHQPTRMEFGDDD